MRLLRWLWFLPFRVLYRFRWYRWRRYQRRLKTAGTPEPGTIFAHEFGSDETGDGATIGTAYRTYARALRDVPLHIPAGTSFTVDVTGLGMERLPNGLGAVTNTGEESVARGEADERRESEIQKLQALMNEDP